MKLFTCPQPGRRILHIDCAEMQQHSIEQAVQILLDLGFEPEIQYRQREGKIGLIIVLGNEPVDYDFGAAFDAIAERFDPDCTCIHATGWPATVALPTAALVAA